MKQGLSLFLLSASILAQHSYATSIEPQKMPQLERKQNAQRGLISRPGHPPIHISRNHRNISRNT